MDVSMYVFSILNVCVKYACILGKHFSQVHVFTNIHAHTLPRDEQHMHA